MANFTANTPGVLVPYLGVVLLARTGGCPLAIIDIIDIIDPAGSLLIIVDHVLDWTAAAALFRGLREMVVARRECVLPPLRGGAALLRRLLRVLRLSGASP